MSAALWLGLDRPRFVELCLDIVGDVVCGVTGGGQALGASLGIVTIGQWHACSSVRASGDGTTAEQGIPPSSERDLRSDAVSRRLARNPFGLLTPELVLQLGGGFGVVSVGRHGNGRPVYSVRHETATSPSRKRHACHSGTASPEPEERPTGAPWRCAGRVAERVGFEPTDRITTINALAGRPIRPLWHLSWEPRSVAR
jgi:hypothetical protein